MSSKSLENEFTKIFIKEKGNHFSILGFGPLAQPAAPL
jgi:hypothetical protein